MSRIILGILMVLTLFSSAYAQKDSTKKAQQDLYKEIYDLRKNISAKDDTIKKLRKDTASLQAKLSAKEKELQTSKSSVLKKQNDSLSARIKLLEVIVIRLQSDSISLATQLSKTKKELDSLSSAKKNNDKLKKDNKKQADTIRMLKNELAKLQPFKQKYLSQMAENVDDDFLNKPFKDIDSVEFEKALKEFNDFASEDKRIAAAAKKLSALKNDYILYRKGVAVVNSPYNATKIKEIKDPLYNLYNKTPQSDKKDDIYNFFWQVNNYASKVNVFKNLIKDVDKRINANKNDAFAFADLELKNQEKKSQAITAIQQIPYLKKLYDDYYAALKKNCFGANPAKDEVLSLIP